MLPCETSVKQGWIALAICLIKKIAYEETFAPTVNPGNDNGEPQPHASDYSYYYNNIKDNVAKRIAAYRASR